MAATTSMLTEKWLYYLPQIIWLLQLKKLFQYWYKILPLLLASMYSSNCYNIVDNNHQSKEMLIVQQLHLTNTDIQVLWSRKYLTNFQEKIQLIRWCSFVCNLKHADKLSWKAKIKLGITQWDMSTLYHQINSVHFTYTFHLWSVNAI